MKMRHLLHKQTNKGEEMKRTIGLLPALFTVIILITAIPAFAADLEGTVVDNESGEALSYASVEIVELKIGIMTDENGSYSIPGVREGEYTVRARRTGYTPSAQTVTIDGNIELDFKLTVNPFVSEEVVSTARGRHTRVEDIPGSVAVIDADDIRESSPAGISEVLAKEPGVTTASDMPWGQRTVIRGMTKDQVVMLVDGARVVTANTLPAQFGTIAQSDVERVEVLKGPLSVLYGSGSTGGVVNVITRSGHFTPELEFDYALNAGYESAAGGVSGYERATVSNENFFISLSQANRKYGDYRAADDSRIRNSQFQDRQSQLNLGTRFGNHRIEARYQNFSVIDVGIPGGSTFPKNAIASYPTSSRILADLKWSWRPEANWIEETSLSTYYQPVERNAKVLPNAPTSVMAHPTDSTKEIHMTAVDILPTADHNVYGFRWQNILALGSHDIVTGIEGWQKDMVSDRTRHIRREIADTATGNLIGPAAIVTIEDTPVPDSTQRPIGVFAEDSFALNDRLKLSIGGRVDQIHTENDPSYLTDSPASDVLIWDSYDDDDLSWSLVAGGVYNLTEKIDLNLSVARSFRSPTIEERYFYGDLGGVVTVGDPELDSENGTFVEAGTDIKLGAVKLNGQAFINIIDDMVIRQPGGDLNGTPVDYKYVNAGKAQLTGFELAADWIAHESLLLSADISYVRGTDEEADTDLPSMPPLRSRVGARWNFGKAYWIEPVATFVANQDKVAPGEEETAGWGRLDIAAGRTVLKTGAVSHDLVIGVRNITDKLYRDHMTVSRGYDVFGMGRSVYVTWQMNGE